jgi:hypothetical protein
MCPILPGAHKHQFAAAGRASSDLGNSEPSAAASRARRSRHAGKKEWLGAMRQRAYRTPPYGLRAEGPLMVGACAGAASGAGMRLCKFGIVAADEPKSVEGFRENPI